MDAREMELKQRAAADLLQQGSHVQVADSGTSAVFSDEERLAAGISIGLQAKGTSGAQWRRLTREAGMKEGTWTAERPPGGAPSSRVKGMAGSGGGVKGPHLDSSAPSLERQGKKKTPTRNTQVRTGTYKEADAVPPFAARGLSGNMDEETDWWRKWQRLKH
jgi:hypothetical protein